MARRGAPLRMDWAVEDTVEALQGRYRRERRVDVRPRLHGLWLVRQGQTTRQVAQVLGVHERTVQRWLAWYRAGGLAAVESRHARQPRGAVVPDARAEDGAGRRGGDRAIPDRR